jgi:hypothetical protein
MKHARRQNVHGAYPLLYVHTAGCKCVMRCHMRTAGCVCIPQAVCKYCSLYMRTSGLYMQTAGCTCIPQACTCVPRA